jgi:hypothetical protein
MEPLSFDVLAAELRRDSQDLSTFHEVLAEKLIRALPPDAVTVRRGGLPFQARRPLTLLKVTLGDRTLEAEHKDGRFEYRLARVVRGIALKTDRVAFDHWLDALAESLYAEAAQSEQIRQALERFLTGGSDALGF